MAFLGTAVFFASVMQVTPIGFWGDKGSVANGESWDLADHHGQFGDFRVERCVRVKEGFVTCKYLVHYDKVHNQIQIVGKKKGMKCVKVPTPRCPGVKTRNGEIDRDQHVTELFLQHCISLTHNLWSINSLVKAEFIDKYQDKAGRWHKCHQINLKQRRG